MRHSHGLTRRTGTASVLGLALIALAGTAGAVPAVAATAQHQVISSGIYDKNCSGKPAAHIIKFYTEKDGTQVPLRCGTSGYGYTHIKNRHGFTSTTNSDISNTLEHYTSVKNDSQTSQTFFLNGYRVAVECKGFSDGYGQGIITAY